MLDKQHYQIVMRILCHKNYFDYSLKHDHHLDMKSGFLSASKWFTKAYGYLQCLY